MLQNDFAKNLCDRVKLLFTCTGDVTTSALVISVKAYAPGVAIPAADLAAPISGGVFTGQPAYQQSNPGDTVVVRAFYQWPLFVTQLGYNIANITGDSGSKRLLAATAAFRVEPGP